MTIDTKENRESASNLVRNEILCCVSRLVSDMAQHEGESDELLDVMCRDDWQGAVEEYVLNDMQREELEHELRQNMQDERAELDGLPVDELRAYLLENLAASEEWQDFADDLRIEPHVSEAFEHWIVADRLADDLESMGEMILRDWHGLTIWGRATTGQAIDQDHVMLVLADRLNKRT